MALRALTRGSFQPRGNERLAAQDGAAEIGGNNVVFAAFRADGKRDLPAFRFTKAVCQRALKAVSDSRSRQ